MLQVLHQQPPVGQVGQRVVQPDVQQPLFRSAQRGDLARQIHLACPQPRGVDRQAPPQVVEGARQRVQLGARIVGAHRIGEAQSRHAMSRIGERLDRPRKLERPAAHEHRGRRHGQHHREQQRPHPEPKRRQKAHPGCRQKQSERLVPQSHGLTRPEPGLPRDPRRVDGLGVAGMCHKRAQHRIGHRIEPHQFGLARRRRAQRQGHGAARQPQQLITRSVDDGHPPLKRPRQALGDGLDLLHPQVESQGPETSVAGAPGAGCGDAGLARGVEHIGVGPARHAELPGRQPVPWAYTRVVGQALTPAAQLLALRVEGNKAMLVAPALAIGQAEPPFLTVGPPQQQPALSALIAQHDRSRGRQRRHHAARVPDEGFGRIERRRIGLPVRDQQGLQTAHIVKRRRHFGAHGLRLARKQGFGVPLRQGCDDDQHDDEQKREQQRQRHPKKTHQQNPPKPRPYRLRRGRRGNRRFGRGHGAVPGACALSRSGPGAASRRPGRRAEWPGPAGCRRNRRPRPPR